MLVQSNFGRWQDLTIAGVPVGREITDLEPVEKPKALVGEFYEAYFGKAEQEHLKEHGK